MGDLTSTCPKPLLKVKGRPMLEWILRRYHTAGFQRVYLAVRYLATKISDRYGNAFEGMRLEYLLERNALGTAGALALLPEPLPLVVSNGDLYTDLSFTDLIDYHVSGNGIIPDATITTVPRVLPYGVVGLPGDIITERPTVRCNAGMYVLEKHLVQASMMSSAHRQDMPDLINRAALYGSKIGVYNMTELWRDVGTPEDLEKANA